MRRGGGRSAAEPRWDLQVTRLLRDKWSVEQKVCALEQPQLNPLHDCTGPLMKAAVAQMVAEKQAEWDDFLDAVLFLFRTTINPTTKFSPYSLMFNRKAAFPNEVKTADVNTSSCGSLMGFWLFLDDGESAELRRAGRVFHEGAGVRLYVHHRGAAGLCEAAGNLCFQPLDLLETFTNIWLLTFVVILREDVATRPPFAASRRFQLN